jgi:hypothetical protein
VWCRVEHSSTPGTEPGIPSLGRDVPQRGSTLTLQVFASTVSLPSHHKANGVYGSGFQMRWGSTRCNLQSQYLHPSLMICSLREESFI